MVSLQIIVFSGWASSPQPDRHSSTFFTCSRCSSTLLEWMSTSSMNTLVKAEQPAACSSVSMTS